MHSKSNFAAGGGSQEDIPKGNYRNNSRGGITCQNTFKTSFLLGGDSLRGYFHGIAVNQKGCQEKIILFAGSTCEDHLHQSVNKTNYNIL